MKTQISNEDLYDIVFAVSALTLEDDYDKVITDDSHIRNY